ncbi:HAMP domain-containing sensor histidine kinase [Latilactobacillus sakei]|uniref:Signal transduction histidine-protein kinase ArlS n=1 Tax=Latilactobacillus sakei TaxID=1599 RepID=A0AAX0VB96_LATSK|nr:HAMP domain-containing histidine kinase [Latilactobacillus sakei]ASN13001.1 two-component sensor histidine kinase [Latilactobacillus sakei]MCM1635240.1 HAMP domain-containing histidine kinase [Latilactobacillus sakei]PKX61389.1 sensor histidine kinase [Latilactobacillus sakei]PKX70293.1 sensor histidine kinase [Latilactobacillus sakei]PKX71923.1 sensor histidine kinase [Latilactobacillus sakei]
MITNDLETPSENNNKGRKISLKVKWAAAVGLAIFITFAIFSIVIFSSISNILLHKEVDNVHDTVTVIQQRLGRPEKTLTSEFVAEQLDPAPRDSKAIYQDSVLMRLAQQDTTVKVYDQNRQGLFASRGRATSFPKQDTDVLKREHIFGKIHLMGIRPIKTANTNRTIGYVEVTNNLRDYNHAMLELRIVLVVVVLFAMLFSAVIGYLLANRFLQPIEAMKQTIEAINVEPNSNVRIPETRRSQDELSDLVIAFNEMLNRIQHYFEQQDQFVSDVSHELRTPVAIIEGHLQLLNRWGKDDPEVLSESLAASLQEILRMKNLIQEMLDLMRADQAVTQGTTEVTDVGKVVLQNYHNFEMLYPEFTFILDDDLHGQALVNINRNHLEQIMIILLDNAIKYSTTRKEIHIAVANDERYAQVAVQDFGEGISEEDKKKVFHRFYRVDKARSREKGGNGLGLAIAQQLVEGYDGNVSLESSVGHGSVFRIELPLVRETKAAPEEDAD